MRIRAARWIRLTICIALALLVANTAAGGVVREPIERGVYALIRNGHSLHLECHLPSGDEAVRTFLREYLQDERGWVKYRGTRRAALPFRELKPAIRRRVLLTIFSSDHVDEKGWLHTVRFAGEEGFETLWSLCEWLTGSGANWTRLKTPERFPRPGQQLLIPRAMLLEAMRRPTASPEPAEAAFDADVARRQLTFDKDAQGPYAVYRIKQGEALFTAVVVRFTDFRENADILSACAAIQARSGIKDVRDIRPGTRVRIPVDMLSDSFRPSESKERKDYEAAIAEARRLRGRSKARNLEGVVVVLDPGHGGRFPGKEVTNNGFKLYEDELVYDIACRVKHLLESDTKAKVHMTMKDRSRGFEPTAKARFVHDTDEELLTSPRYRNTDHRVSANLRAYFANHVLDNAVKRGVDPSKVVFTSFHCDALYNERLRGTMVYIPGAKYRKARETPQGTAYSRYRESKGANRTIKTTNKECVRDEALSRNFAETLLGTLGKRRIKRHDQSNPIRNVIRQDGGVRYVPAVLRLNKIPTKVLVETANLTNTTDCSRVQQSWWRQRFAEAYVDALKAHFGA